MHYRPSGVVDLVAMVHEPDPRASFLRNVAGINLQVVIDALNNATRSAQIKLWRRLWLEHDAHAIDATPA